MFRICNQYNENKGTDSSLSRPSRFLSASHGISLEAILAIANVSSQKAQSHRMTCQQTTGLIFRARKPNRVPSADSFAKCGFCLSDGNDSTRERKED